MRDQRKDSLKFGSNSYWETFSVDHSAEQAQGLWRAHSDAVNNALLDRWWPVERFQSTLKTDLFDEAVQTGLIPSLIKRSKNVVGIDIAWGVHQLAKQRYPSLRTISADVRRLPFVDGAFDSIVSNSTLDHFESMADLSVALSELHRVLRPGGQLILTLDNPTNPVVFLRNQFPYWLLRNLGAIPYYVGKTLSLQRLRCLLEGIGFHLLETDAILHCPRILAVALTHWIERHSSDRMQHSCLTFLMSFEKISRLPTRFLTGHFVAVRCIRS